MALCVNCFYAKITLCSYLKPTFEIKTDKNLSLLEIWNITEIFS